MIYVEEPAILEECLQPALSRNSQIWFACILLVYMYTVSDLTRSAPHLVGDLVRDGLLVGAVVHLGGIWEIRVAVVLVKLLDSGISSTSCSGNHKKDARVRNFVLLVLGIRWQLALLKIDGESHAATLKASLQKSYLIFSFCRRSMGFGQVATI